MAIIRNAANTFKRGRVGETTYYVADGRQVARQALNNSNYGESARRTQGQQTQRVKWANLVSFYKASKDWMPKAFENRKNGQTDYNRLMQINIPYTDIALTKAKATVGACVVEDYLISQGSLPSINITKHTTHWDTDIKTGDLVIDDDTTVAEFTTAIVDNNTHISAGMQLSFVSYQQTVDALGVPRVICTFYEVTLSTSNEEKLRSYMPTFCTISKEGTLSTNTNISTGAFAYVLSDLRGGSLLVSTQQLITNNDTLIKQYSSDSNLLKAIESYGVDEEVVLSPDTTNEQDATDQPNYISYLMLGTTKVVSGDTTSVIADDQGFDIYMANTYTGGSSSSVSVEFNYSETADARVESISGKKIHVALTNATGDKLYPLSVTLTSEEGTEYTITLVAPSGSFV